MYTGGASGETSRMKRHGFMQEGREEGLCMALVQVEAWLGCVGMHAWCKMVLCKWFTHGMAIKSAQSQLGLEQANGFVILVLGL